MRTGITFGITASLLAIAVSAHLIAQRAPGAQTSKRSGSVTSAIWGRSMCSPARWTRRMRRSRIGANTTRPRGGPLS
jgi:hypothetical protein